MASTWRPKNGKRNRRTKQEQRVLAHYALQEGGKALEEGLKRKAENFSNSNLFLTTAEAER